MSKAVFFHAGCPVCVEAEQQVAKSLDPSKYDVEIVQLGEVGGRLGEAESAGSGRGFREGDAPAEPVTPLDKKC